MRQRVAVFFVVFGTVVCGLVFVVATLSPAWQITAVSLLAIVMLLGVGGWCIGTYVTRDLGKFLSAFQHADAFKVLKKGDTEWLSGNANSKETQDIAKAFEAFVLSHRDAVQEYEERVQQCERQRDDASITLRNFMYQVAHVLRTPVNAIRWNVETLKNEEQGRITESQRETLDQAEYSAIRLLHLADELQDTLAVLRGERLHMRPESNDLVSIIDEVAGKIAIQARRNTIGLAWRHPEKKIPSTLCDRGRIEQVLYVLLDNAIRYSRPGGRVTVSLHAVDEKTPASELTRLHMKAVSVPSVVVAVQDAGMGIPRSEQQRTFQPFFRGEEAKQIWVDGKGIALTISQAIVQQCGGTIWFHSQPKKGSVFYFSLPAVF